MLIPSPYLARPSGSDDVRISRGHCQLLSCSPISITTFQGCRTYPPASRQRSLSAPRYPHGLDGCALLDRHQPRPKGLASVGPLRHDSSRSRTGSLPMASHQPQSRRRLPHGWWGRTGGPFTPFKGSEHYLELFISFHLAAAASRHATRPRRASSLTKLLPIVRRSGDF